MTLAEARALQVGDYVASGADSWTVRRVTDHSVGLDGTWVRVRLASFRQGEWVPVEGFAKCPTMRTDAFPYRSGDTLLPEHRPSRKDTENAQAPVCGPIGGGALG